jgi:hypothetical protein
MNHHLLPYIIAAWAILSIIKLIIQFFYLQKNSLVFIYIIIHCIAALVAIYFHPIVALIISALANVHFYWFFKPKQLKNNNA